MGKKSTRTKLSAILAVFAVCVVFSSRVLFRSPLILPSGILFDEFPAPQTRTRHATEVLFENGTVFFESAEEAVESGNRSILAICTASRSESRWRHAEQSLLKKYLIASVEETIEAGELNEWNVRLYVAIDADDDTWYQLAKSIRGPSWLTIRFVIYPRILNRIPFNEILKLAHDEGAEYFCRVNDDTQFLTSGWITLASTTLQNFDPPNVGVVGPLCGEGNTWVLTHDFVHRKHLEIFEGNYYPPAFKNWYLDNWITNIYDSMILGHNFSRIKIIQDWQVKHWLSETRYKPDSVDSLLLPGEQKAARERIRKYLLEKHPQHAPYVGKDAPMSTDRISHEQAAIVLSTLSESDKMLVFGLGSETVYLHEKSHGRIAFVDHPKPTKDFYEQFKYLEVFSFTKTPSQTCERLLFRAGFTTYSFGVILLLDSTDDCIFSEYLRTARAMANFQFCRLSRRNPMHIFVSNHQENSNRSLATTVLGVPPANVTHRSNNATSLVQYVFDGCNNK